MKEPLCAHSGIDVSVPSPIHSFIHLEHQCYGNYQNRSIGSQDER